MMPIRSPARRRGFTLLEVALTTVVIGILAAAAVPSYANYLARERLRHVAQLLDLDLRRARATSVDQNTNVYVSFGGGRQWCWGLSRAAPCDCTTGLPRCDMGTVAAGPYPGTLLQAGRGMAFESGLGRAIGWSAVGLSNDRNHQIHLDLNPSGRPALCGPDAPKSNPC